MLLSRGNMSDARGVHQHASSEGEIFPLPLFAPGGQFCQSRSRRVQQRQGRQRVVRDRVNETTCALNDLDGSSRDCAPLSSAARESVCARILDAVANDRPMKNSLDNRTCVDPGAAWNSIQGGAGPRSYSEDPCVEQPYCFSLLSLPRSAGTCNLLDNLVGDDF